MIYSPNGLMRYNDSVAIVDDMPLLSQWIKKHSFKRTSVFWQGQKDLNPRHSVLETDALPTELYPYIFQLFSVVHMVDRQGLEPRTDRL